MKGQLKNNIGHPGRMFAILTVILPSRSRINAGYDVRRLSLSVDFFNLMTYDLRGPWDGSVDHHSPLVPRTTDTYLHKGLNTRDGVVNYVRAGAPKHKIVVGVPFYGRTFTLANSKEANLGAMVSE